MKKNTRKLSKIIAPVALTAGCLGALPAASCGMHSSVKHIAPYLHEITYDDYREDTEYETIKEAEAFGCSSVRNGNFYGRNFDYVFNDTPEFVVRVKANKKKNRHESIAIATHFGLRENKLLKGRYHKQLELIPNLTMDGINDAGVICSSNVVSMEPNGEEGVQIPETRPNDHDAKDLHVLFIPRFVLDNATSADDAVAKLRTMNIMGNLNKKMNIHTMIADKNKTIVVEFFKDITSSHNHFDVIAKEKPGIEAIMTNHYLNMDGHAKGWINDEKFGNERLEILKNGYNTVHKLEDMTALMRKVQFSIAYSKTGHNPVPYGITTTDGQHGNLTSEWYSENIKQSVIASASKYTYAQCEEFAADSLGPLKDAYEKKIREEAKSEFWITTHNTTYDMEKKMLRVIVQEDYEHWYDYYL